MGQENSRLIDNDTPPQTLSARTLSAVADLIKNGGARRIVVMTGAGISTAAGIPDFRSPKTGLYHNLARLNLPHAEDVFDIAYFRGPKDERGSKERGSGPEAFYVLAKELYPGNYSPTISHVFIALLAQKGLLRMLFTQNIDCLEREAGVPSELIVEAHGSFATQRCIDCGRVYPDDKMKEHVLSGIVPHCEDKTCNGYVKPDIVFFGESLPEAFYRNRSVPATADLALVMGTSLSVHPFARLPEEVLEGTPRVLFNLERVGSLGSRADDVLVLDDCDSGVRMLADELGWREELEDEWRRIVGHEEAEAQLRGRQEREEVLEEEVSKLAKEVEQGLVIGGGDADEDGSKEKKHGREEQQSIAKDSASTPVRKQEATRIPEKTTQQTPKAGDSSREETPSELRHLEEDSFNLGSPLEEIEKTGVTTKRDHTSSHGTAERSGEGFDTKKPDSEVTTASDELRDKY